MLGFVLRSKNPRSQRCSGVPCAIFTLTFYFLLDLSFLGESLATTKFRSPVAPPINPASSSFEVEPWDDYSLHFRKYLGSNLQNHRARYYERLNLVQE